MAHISCAVLRIPAVYKQFTYLVLTYSMNLILKSIIKFMLHNWYMCTMPDPSIMASMYLIWPKIVFRTLVDFLWVLQECVQYHSDCSYHMKPKGMLITNRLSVARYSSSNEANHTLPIVLLCVIMFVHKQKWLRLNYRCKRAMQNGWSANCVNLCLIVTITMLISYSLM